jgi:hypothetical protein
LQRAFVNKFTNEAGDFFFIHAWRAAMYKFCVAEKSSVCRSLAIKYLLLCVRARRCLDGGDGESIFHRAPALNNARYIIITSTHGWNMKEARFNIQMAVCVEYLLLTRLSEIAAFHSAIAR